MTANPLSSIPPLGPSAGPAPGAQPGKFKPIDPVKLVRSNLRIFVAAACIGLFAGAASFVIMLFKDPGFTSVSQLAILANEDTRDVSSSLVKSQDEDVEGLVAIEKTILESEATSLLAVQDRDVRATGWYRQFDDNANAAAKALREDVLGVATERKSAIIRVSATTNNPNDSQLILARFLSLYQNQRTQDDSERTRNELRQLDNVIANATDQQRAAELALNRFIGQHNIQGRDARFTEAGQAFDQVTEELNLTRASLRNAEESAKSLADKFAAGLSEPTADVRYGFEQQPAIQNIDNSIRGLKTEIDIALTRFGEQHSTIKQYRERIAALERSRETTMIELYESQQKGLLEAQQKAVASLTTKVTELEAQQVDLREELTDYEQRKQELESLIANRDNAQIALAEARANRDRGAERLNRPQRQVQINRPAETAERTSPGLVFTVAGPLFLFLGFTAGLTFVRELLDQRISSPADVKMVPDAKLLGVIPDANEDPSGEGEIDRVVERDPAGLLAESFRQARTALMAKMDRRGYKTVAICSPQPSSGATTVAQNLAMSLAYNGRRVALVEANFRRPRMAGLIGLPETPGLIDVLEGRASLDDATHVLEGVSVAVIPAGNLEGARAEMLEGAAFRSLLGRLETEYDLVVIDTAPALLTAEARLLVKQVDALAIVVRAGDDKRGMLGRMIGQLDGNRADLLGVILNGVRSAAGGYFRENYEQFYAYTRGADDRLRRPADKPSKPDKPSKSGGRLAKSPKPNKPAKTQKVAKSRKAPAGGTSTATTTALPSNGSSPLDELSETEALAGLADLDGLGGPITDPTSDTDHDGLEGFGNGNGRTGAEGSGFWDDDDDTPRNGG
ncbi:MAG: AAA family ATPase [Planctomycetota bacterium]